MTMTSAFHRRIGLKVLGAFLAAIAPLIGIIAYCNIHLCRDALEHARDQIARAVSETAAEQDGIVAELREMLGLLASLDAAREPDLPDLTITLRQIKDKKSHLANIFLCDLQGIVTASAEPGAVGRDVRTCRYFRDPLRRDGFCVGHFSLSRMTGSPAMHFSCPVRDLAGRTTGVLVAALDLDGYARRFDHLSIPEGGFLELLDDQGRLLLRHPPAPDAVAGRPMPPALAAHLSAGQASGVFVDAEPGQDGIILASRRLRTDSGDPEPYGTMLIGLPLATAMETTNRRLRVSVAVSAASVLVAIALAVALGRVVIVGRLRVLAELVQAVERDQVCLLPHDFGDDEIGLLGRRFTALSRELHEKSQALAETLDRLRREKDRLETVVAKLGLAQSELVRRANHDALTGLANRRAFNALLVREITRTRRYGTPFSLALCDIDDFKVVNDTFGHWAGDDVLRFLAELLPTCLREADTAFRVGGEEFALILPATNGTQALAVAERLREAVARSPAPLSDGGAVRFTISLGLADCPPDLADGKELYKAADQALYRAKASGKNRSILWSPEAAT